MGLICVIPLHSCHTSQCCTGVLAGDVLLYGADEGEMLDENPHYKKHHRVPQFFVVFGLWQDIWNKLAGRNGSGIFQMECWYSVFICEG